MDCSLCQSLRAQNSASFTEKEIIQHVEHLARGSVDAVNRKSYDIYSKDWNYLASSLLIEFAHPSYRGPQRMPLIAYLDLLQQNTKRWPQYKATILDQSTIVNEEMNEAVVFENAEVEGAPPGVTTKLVIVLDFKLRAAPRVGEEPWRCVSLRSAIGI
ncbi:hypothetical protein Slin15195_G113250 [Septoria linicola]|uniref:Uncharacterized protein n=1 Tax=Septoria linicola TaxID=215465 RepID=A0A9Q9ENP2_9PEZI|nr:hypothetical protein Slin15195_G113250 [Septoria linicola]